MKYIIMKNNCILFFISIVASLLSCDTVKGQGNLKELATRIGNTKNFHQIQQIAKAYFDGERRAEAIQRTGRPATPPNEEKEFENAETFYHRWAWYNGSRLDANGNITDYTAKSLQAISNEVPSTANNYNSISSLNSNSDWSLEGPTTYTPQYTMADGQGRTDCIAFHPTNANTMYAGTPMGGLWKTTTGGLWWNQVAGLFPFLGIHGIVVNKDNGNEIWVLAGSPLYPNTWGIFATEVNCRVYHSTDAGVNWFATEGFNNVSPGMGYDLIQDPSAPNTIYAATDSGVYRTTTGGTAWLKVLSERVYDLEFSGTRLLATGSEFLNYNDYSGAPNGWYITFFTPPVTGMTRASLAVSPSSPTTVYLLAGPAATGSFQGLYKSTNSGGDWFRQSNTPNIFDSEPGSGSFDQSSYDNCILAHPTDPAKILTGGAIIWESSNSGVTMTSNTYYSGNAVYPTKYVHPDVHAIKQNPLNNNVYACTDGGIYLSTNFGANWSRRTNGLAAAQIFHMTTYKNNPTMEAFGSQDNGMKIRRNNGNYEMYAQGDGYAAQFSLNDSSIMYLTLNEQFYKNSTFGSTGLAVTYPFLTSADKWYILPKVTPSATNTEIVFAGALDTLSRSTNGGSSWTRIVRRANWDISYGLSNPAIIYTAGGINYAQPLGFTLSRNNNYGTGTWTDISGTLGNFGQRAMKIAVAPYDALRIYVCLGGYTAGQKVYRSLNGGTIWTTNISYNLPNVPVNALAADNVGNVYAGTDIGVYVLPAGAVQWVAFYNGLPRVPITDLIVNDTYGFLKASTFGCGIWKTDLYGGCPVNLTVSGIQTGHKTFEASGFINSPALTMSGGNGLTDIRLKAGDKIIFGPGSNLQNGTMVASVGPCGVPFPNIVPIQRNNSGNNSNLTSPAVEGNKLKDRSITTPGRVE